MYLFDMLIGKARVHQFLGTFSDKTAVLLA